jgi:hypothetical protein
MIQIALLQYDIPGRGIEILNRYPNGFRRINRWIMHIGMDKVTGKNP